MPALSFATTARIATRELRSSRGKFAFVVLSVAIGVAALTGVRGFSSAFRTMLLLRARTIMAADLSVHSSQAFTPADQAKLNDIAARNGARQTPVTEMLSMASASTSLDPLLVSLKAVDPTRYPFYGSVTLSPAMPLTQALTDSSVAVGDDLLLRLHLRVGDSIRLNNQLFRIAATVINEPDRLSGAFAAGPRVLISQHALDKTGLLGFGSRASRRVLLLLPQPAPGISASDKTVEALRDQLQSALPEAGVTDYRDANEGLTRALDGATGVISLMSLVALVLGAIGVAMAIRAHLAQRLDSIAIMKALGAGSGHIIRIYVLQTLLLGLCGGVLGVLLGFGLQLILPLFLVRIVHFTPGFRVNLHVLGLGLSAGLLTTLLFSLPPLLDIRDVRPILILRRAVESSADPFTTRFLGKLRKSGGQAIAFVLILGGLILLATRVSDSRQIGSIFGVGLAGVLIVLLAMAAGVLALLRVLLRRTRLGLPSVLRHGLANLYRPGNPSAALLAALGLGIMQIATVYTVQHAVVSDISESTLSRLPNLFLLDISPNEVDGVRSLLTHQRYVQGAPELLPVIAARLAAVNGKPVEQLSLEGFRKRGLRALNLSWPPTPDQPPPGDRVVDGQWWTAEQSADAANHPVIALDRNFAKGFHLNVGQDLTFVSEDKPFTARIVAIYEPDSQHAFSRAQLMLPEAALKGFSAIWYAGVHSDPNHTAEVRRALYEHNPSITVIDVAATIETVREAVLQIVYIVQFLAGFSTFAGVVILASAIAGTRYRRIREVVVLKTLGATRPRIAAIFSIEFATLGLIAGAVGLVFANVVSRILLHRALHFDYHFQPALTLLFWLVAGLLTVACGWIASHRVLGQKPLEVLREE